MEQPGVFITILAMVAIPILLVIFVVKRITKSCMNLANKKKQAEEVVLQNRLKNSYLLQSVQTQIGRRNYQITEHRVSIDKTEPYDGKFLNFKEFSIFVIIQEQPEVTDEDDDDYYDYSDNHLVFHDRYAWAEFLQKYSGDMTKFSKVLIFKKADVFHC